jgi:hypothetical protein
MRGSFDKLDTVVKYLCNQNKITWNCRQSTYYRRRKGYNLSESLWFQFFRQLEAAKADLQRLTAEQIQGFGIAMKKSQSLLQLELGQL